MKLIYLCSEYFFLYNFELEKKKKKKKGFWTRKVIQKLLLNKVLYEGRLNSL